MAEVSSIKKCPVCESRSLKIRLVTRDPDNLFDTPFNLLRCNSCGFIFLGEIIKANGLYTRTYYRNPKALLKIFFNFVLYIFILDRIRLIRKYKKKPGKILDIGCGDGSFLMHIKKYGWDVLGIDTSLAVDNYMANKNLPLLKGDFVDTDIEPESMDMITYWYSFEHLTNPLDYLNKTYRVLKKDGILVISVQNIESLQAVLCASKWFHLDIPRHILHFSPLTLEKILSRADFMILDIAQHSLQMNVFGWHQSLLNLLGCQTNFLYKSLKRDYNSTTTVILSFLITLLLSPFIFPLSVILAKMEEFCKRGGVITVIAKKRI